MCHEENRFLFLGQEGPWSGPYVKNNKTITFLLKPDFIVFLICVKNGSGVSFGRVVNYLEFIPHHMKALIVYMCLDSRSSYNFELWKTSTCASLAFNHDLWVLLYRSW